MIILNNRLTLLLVVILLMLAFIFFKNLHSVSTRDVPVVASNLSVSTKKINLASTSLPSVSEIKNKKVNTNPIKESYTILSPAETGELKNWVATRGYFSKEDEAIYKTYSDQVLEELGKQGDIKALTVLTSRLIQGGNMAAAIRYVNMNIVLGSTTALDTLTLFTVPSIYEKNEATIRSSILETLAVAQVMNLRGDRTLANVSMHDTSSIYKIRYDTDLKLTDVEQQFVEKRGQELYDAYQNVRREKGLGDFDNEDPSPVKKFFESIFGAK